MFIILLYYVNITTYEYIELSKKVEISNVSKFYNIKKII